MLIMLLSVFRPCLFLAHSDSNPLCLMLPPSLILYLILFSCSVFSNRWTVADLHAHVSDWCCSPVQLLIPFRKKNPDLNGDAVFSTPAERYMREKNTASTQLPLRIIICSIDDSKSFLDSVCLNIHFPILHLPWSLPILFVFSLTIVDVKEYQTTCWLDFKHGDRGCQ